jgi:RimJ/RimL family protein N-acetyltransferase
MRKIVKLSGDRIYLKLLNPRDVSTAYAEWMNDSEVTQFLESRWKKYTIKEIKDYVLKMNSSKDNYLFGIFLKDSKQHFGNIKIGAINPIHRFADVGLLIGNKSLWGKGYATEAIKLVTKYVFKELKLNKLFAGIYSNNIASYKAFMKAGYKEAGRLKKHYFCSGKFVDKIIVEKIK